MKRYVKVGPKHYVRTKTLRYLSPRYGKWIIVNKGDISDGATGAFDIESESWWVHDKMCSSGVWLDGSRVDPKEAANVLSDILKSEGRYFRAFYWKWFTYLFGCDKTWEDL